MKKSNEIKQALGSDEPLEFYRLLSLLGNGEVTNYVALPWIHHIFSFGAIKCFKKLIDEKIEMRPNCLDYIAILASRYNYPFINDETKKNNCLRMIDFIIAYFKIDLNSIKASQEIGSNMPYIILVAEAPEIFSLFLKHGANPFVLFNLKTANINQTGIIDLETALQKLYENTGEGQYLQSKEILKEYKTSIREKSELGELLPLKQAEQAKLVKM